MHQLADFFPHTVVGYTQMVTITAEDLISSNELRQGTNSWWTFLHDDERAVQKDLDIQEYTDEINDPMIPHTFVLRPGLIVHKVYMGYWYWGRPSTHELWMDLREITRDIRPDWDIQTREMREKWDRGEMESFWPFGKPMPEALAHMSYAVDQFSGECARHVEREPFRRQPVGAGAEKR